MRLFIISVSLLLAAIAFPASAEVPIKGEPSAAAHARARFSAKFYVMHWDAPDRFDYSYRNGELSLHVQHFGPTDAEKADLRIHVKTNARGRYAVPAQATAAYNVLGCAHRIDPGSYVEITRMDGELIEGRFELNGKCQAAPASSQAMREGRFRLVFDKPRPR